MLSSSSSLLLWLTLLLAAKHTTSWASHKPPRFFVRPLQGDFGLPKMGRLRRTESSCPNAAFYMVSGRGAESHDDEAVEPRCTTRSLGQPAVKKINSSRRSALGAGLLGIITFAPLSSDTLASVLLTEKPGSSSSAVQAEGALAAAKHASKGKQALPEFLQTAINMTVNATTPSKEAEAKAREAKAKNEANSIDSRHRKEMVQIEQDLQTDLKSLQNGINKRLDTISTQLEEGYGKSVLPVPEDDVRLLDKQLRAQARSELERLEAQISRMDARLTEFDFEVQRKKTIEEYENKQRELGKQMRAAAKKVSDKSLKRKMTFEADILEKTGNRQLTLNDRIEQTKYQLQQRYGMHGSGLGPRSLFGFGCGFKA